MPRLDTDMIYIPTLDAKATPKDPRYRLTITLNSGSPSALRALQDGLGSDVSAVVRETGKKLTGAVTDLQTQRDGTVVVTAICKLEE